MIAAAAFFVVGLITLCFASHHVAAGNLLRGSRVSGDQFFISALPSLLLASALIWSLS